MDKRITEVIEHLIFEHKIKNDSDFAEVIGKSRGTISDIKKGRRTISVQIANLITDAFPEINGSWLLTGEGEMLKREEKEETEEVNTDVYVPLLPIEALGGELTGFDIEGVMPYECEMVVNPFPQATHAITVRGDSMYPTYPSGCRIYIRRVNQSMFIEWGAVHVIDTDGNGVILKVLTKAENDDEVLCLSLNPEPRYAPFTIEKQYIRSLWLVVGTASITHM